jgi:hypothetical protein
MDGILARAVEDAVMLNRIAIAAVLIFIFITSESFVSCLYFSKTLGNNTGEFMGKGI